MTVSTGNVYRSFYDIIEYHREWSILLVNCTVILNAEFYITTNGQRNLQWKLEFNKGSSFHLYYSP